MGKPYPTRVEYLESYEVEEMLKNCDNLKEYLIIRLLWRTGITVSELISLRVENILWDEELLLIKSRLVPLDEETLRLLKEYVETYFIKDKLFPYTRQHIYYLVRDVGKKAGFYKVYPQQLRHSFAIYCLKKGMRVKTLQKILGHKSFHLTAYYLKFLEVDTTLFDIKEEYKRVWG